MAEVKQSARRLSTGAAGCIPRPAPGSHSQGQCGGYFWHIYAFAACCRPHFFFFFFGSLHLLPHTLLLDRSSPNGVNMCRCSRCGRPQRRIRPRMLGDKRLRGFRLSRRRHTNPKGTPHGTRTKHKLCFQLPNLRNVAAEEDRDSVCSREPRRDCAPAQGAVSINTLKSTPPDRRYATSLTSGWGSCRCLQSMKAKLRNIDCSSRRLQLRRRSCSFDCDVDTTLLCNRLCSALHDSLHSMTLIDSGARRPRGLRSMASGRLAMQPTISAITLFAR